MANVNIPDEGVVAHIRKLRSITDQFGAELDALKQLETALRIACDRLDRGASLVSLETRLVNALINREPADKNQPEGLVKRVEEDLAALIASGEEEKK